MAFEDFCNQFTEVEILLKNMNEFGMSKGKTVFNLKDNDKLKYLEIKGKKNELKGQDNK